MTTTSPDLSRRSGPVASGAEVKVRAAVQGEGVTARTMPRPRALFPPPAVVVGCLAYTRDRGWHFGTVDLDALRRCDQEGDRGRTLVPHGTLAAARRHRRDGTRKCQPCRDVENAYLREYRRRKAAS
jgi:hypothetical protein